jgi:hypothetical protein
MWTRLICIRLRTGSGPFFDTVKDLTIFVKRGNLLDSLATISLSSRTLHRGDNLF